MHPNVLRVATAGLCLALLAAVGQASTGEDEPVIVVDGTPFMTWAEYTSSPMFQEKNLRCRNMHHSDEVGFDRMTDCDYRSTNPSPQWDPTYTIHIPVVVHILQHTNGNGQISDALVQSQIDIMNEDFQAIPGTNGQNGVDCKFQFFLANRDPQGNPTTGITRSTNNTWYNDGGQYYNDLAWDPNRYMNVYTNSAQGFLGYVPFLPQNGSVGSKSDRIVCLWSAFGRDAPIGPPYDQGRTMTHEIGHYLGLWHTFDNGCGGGNCYTSGDYVCDTNAESNPRFGCPGGANSCGSPDPIDNYMDYSDDLCMERFTPEQCNRMRCTLENFRPDLECIEGLVVTRTGGGTNLDSAYTSNSPYLGGTLNATVDMTGSGFASVILLGYLAPATVTLSGGQVLLVDPSSPRVMRLFQGGPVANFSLPVPDDPTICGLQLFTQGMLIGGNPSFGLTNSQDWTLGF